VDATYDVPMLFLRVVGVGNSTVAVRSIAKIRFVNMMIVVDRSGSVQRVGSPAIIKSSLTQFVANSATSIFVNGRDVVGLLSYGGNYNLDFAPTTNFQTSAPAIGTAINNLYFDTNNSTNTGEGLYQGWYELAQLNQNGALNVILLITDGRPSALTGTFTVDGPYCTDRTPKQGVITSSVANPFPPPTNRTTSGVIRVTPSCSTAGCEPTTFVANSNGCRYKTQNNGDYFDSDISTIPAIIGPVNHITGVNVPNVTTFPSTTGFYTGGGNATNNAVSLRYAAFNYADNVAKAIRMDTTYKPVIYAIGLTFNQATYPNEEPLDADFLARLANDPSYISPTTGLGVYQAGQTAGKYYNVTYNGLAAALQDITGQILRLSTN
jgi:hypothetical protein